MAFDIEETTDATTSFEEKRDDPTYSEETAERSGGVGTTPGDSSDEVEPRRLMKDPTINDIRWLYRTSWAKTLVDKPIDDIFKNGYEIRRREENSDEDNGRNFRGILERNNWEENYKTAKKKARRDGFALNFLILNDNADGPWVDPMDEDVDVQGVHKIETLTLDDLARYKSSRGVVKAGDRLDPLTSELDYDDYHIRPTGIVVDTDPSSDTYKEPLGYLVGPDKWPANRDKVKFIHRNRVRHYVENPEVDADLGQNTYGTYEGDSILVSSYHILKGIKKGNWSLMQTIFRYAAKLYHVALPEDADEDDWENANDQLQNLNAKGEVITPHGYEMDDFQTDGQLEPEEYFDTLFKQVCASNEMTKSVLFGTQSGTVSGSETDIKNYFNKVERMRQREVADDMREFVEHYVRLTDNRASEDYTAMFEVEWGPLFKMTELDQAETLSRKMQTLSAAINNFVLTPAEARSVLNEEWAELDIDNDALSDEEREFIEAIQVAQMGAEASLTNRNEQEGVQQGSTQQQNGGGREQGQMSDPDNPTADSPVDDPEDPDQWGNAIEQNGQVNDAVVDAIADRVIEKMEQ